MQEHAKYEQEVIYGTTYDRYVYVIGWSTVVFGINSTSNAVRKCKIARGEAECYLLPDCIASAINPKYHSRPSYHRLILHLS